MNNSQALYNKMRLKGVDAVTAAICATCDETCVVCEHYPCMCEIVARMENAFRGEPIVPIGS